MSEGLEMLNGIPVIELAIRAYRERIKSGNPPSLQASFADGFEAGVEAARTPGPATRELLELFREILARPHDNVSVARMTMRAVIAEHEAMKGAGG